MKKRRPLKGLRTRRRANGTTRMWWEPSAAERDHGIEPVELDADRPTWSERRARELNDEAAATVTGKARRGPGGKTMTALIARYRRDPMFTSKKDKTRRGYLGFLRIIERKWGGHAVISFTKPVLREWYLANTRERGETMAARLNAMMSVLFGYAELVGWRAEGSNPCSHLKVKANPAKRSRTAGWGELDALIAAAHQLDLPDIAMAIRLSTFQGQRQRDVITARPADFDSWPARRGDRIEQVLAWKVLRSKNGTLGLVEIHPELLADLRDLLDRRDNCDVLLLDNRTGTPFTEDSFQRRWRDVRALAAQTCPSITAPGSQLQFRDLRRTFGVWARDGGASVDDTADVLGNSAAQDAMLEDTYMPPSFETASRAVRAISRPTPKKKRKRA